MTTEEIGKEIDGAVLNSLDTEWIVSNKSDMLTVESKELSAYAQLEAQQNGAYILTGYVKTNWDGEDSVPLLDFYVEFTDAKAAIDELLEYCQVQEDVEDEVWTDNATVVSLETIAKTIEETDAVFAAVSEEHLARGLFTVIYHVPPGGDEERVFSALRDIGGVIIDGRPFPLRLSSVLASGAHLYRRLPLYVDNTSFGPDEVTIKNGAQQVREFVENDNDSVPLPGETVTGDTLVKKLIDTGAVAVAAEPEISDEEMLSIVVWNPDATAYEDVGSFEKITLGETTQNLNIEFRCLGGPNFLGRVPVYADDNIIGMEPVAAEKGIKNLNKYVESGCPRSLVDTPWGEEQ